MTSLLDADQPFGALGVSLLRVMVIYNCRCLFLTNPVGGATTLSCISWTDYQNANVEVSKDYLNKVITINDTHMYSLESLDQFRKI